MSIAFGRDSLERDVTGKVVKDLYNNKLEENKSTDSYYQLSSKGEELLKEFEGTKEYQKNEGHFRENKFYPYKDSVDNPTIGYGHLITNRESFKSGISEKEADILLRKDIKSTIDYVKNTIKNPNLTKKQIDSFISLAYNVKKKTLSESKTVSMINNAISIDKKKGKSLGTNWKEFRKASNKVNKGLEKRRKIEWDYGEWDDFGK